MPNQTPRRDAGAADAASTGGGDAGPVTQTTCDLTKSAVPLARVWRLTPAQINASIIDLVGETAPAVRGDLFRASAVGGFSNNAGQLKVYGGDAVTYRLTAKAVASRTVQDAGRLAKVFASQGCDATKLADATCARQFVTNFGRRVFRRPLTTTESDRYVALYQLGQAKGAKLGVQAVVEAMLQSPNFLFRSEAGPANGMGKVRMTSYEIAAALSYLLTGSTPDDMLLAAAEKNELGTPAQVEAQARRLLQDRGKASPAVSELFWQLFEYDGLLTRPKDAAAFPDYEALRGDMMTELKTFLDDLMFGSGDGKLASLFTASHTFVSPALAKVYDPKATLAQTGKFMLDSQQRAGVLTMPGLMSVLAVLERTSPVNRGRWVQEKLFCRHIPDPPPTVDTTLPPLPPNSTFRQQLEARTSEASCSACHALMNPIGFGLENLDGMGRWRTTDNGAPINATGTLSGTDVDGSFTGPRELAMKLASSQQVKQCIATQTFRYALGQSETELGGDYSCAVKTIYDKFAASGFSLKELLVGVVSSEAFTHRNRVAASQ